MHCFPTIEKFTSALIEHPIKDFPEIIKNANLSMEELLSAASWEKGTYTRNCLARTEKFEIILLCWEVDAKTPIHDHGGEKCWVYQADGKLEEVRYNHIVGELEESQRMNLTPGNLTFMNDEMGYHTIENNSGARAMSLHIYASPIDSCNVYNANLESFRMKELSYDQTVEFDTIPMAIGA